MAKKMRCEVCDDTGWVCEDHGDRPLKGDSKRGDACDYGVGMPCPHCNSCDGIGEPPDISRMNFKVTIDRKGPRQ
jgi:hypothetical protein